MKTRYGTPVQSTYQTERSSKNVPLCLDVSRNLSRKGLEALLFVFLKCQIQHFYVSVGNKELLLTQRKSTAVPLISASLIIKLSHIDMSRMVKSFLPAPLYL